MSPRALACVEWTALVVTVLGAVITSLFPWLYPLNISILLAGCVIYVVWAVLIGKHSLVWLNAMLGTIHLLGILAWMANSLLDITFF